MLYIIEDEFHAEHIFNKEFDTFEDALNEIIKYSKIPWGSVPNKCPCENWQSCQRDYIIYSHEDKCEHILTKSSKGNIWHYKINPNS